MFADISNGVPASMVLIPTLSESNMTWLEYMDTPRPAASSTAMHNSIMVGFCMLLLCVGLRD